MTAAEPAAGLDRIAEALPAYEIGGELGRGGWGVVLEGRHRHLHRAVAIKQLPPAFASDPDARSRFMTEARMLASLDHPHVVPVYDFVERDGLCLLVMEKLAGGTVWDRFAGDGIEAEAACAVALATAVALHHAHSRGVLHRDVKPENLLFADGGRLKVSDFGIAKMLTGERTMATRAGDILGTPAYMAPEQALAEAVSPATDVYALAVVLYELLSGRLPFEVGEGASLLALLYARVHQAPVDLRAVAPHVADPVADVVMRSLAASPADRPQTTEDFAGALAEATTAWLGPGWLDRSGVEVAASGRILSRTAQTPAAAPRATARPAPMRASTHPHLTVRAIDADPAELVAVHELAELGLLERLRAGAVRLTVEEAKEAERLLGGSGTSAAARAGLAAEAGPDELREAIAGALARWQRRAENPISTRPVVDAARVLVRTCEGLLADLSP